MAVRQALHKAGRGGALVRNEISNKALINIYDVDLLLEHFYALMDKKTLNNRINNKNLALWSAYIQYLEEFKDDIY
jgi:hypothetical protein